MNKQVAMEILPWLKKESDLPGAILSDVTSRDWLQSLSWWNYWTAEQRAMLTKKLSDFGIHHIELGFPAIIWDPEYDAVKLSADAMWDSNAVVMWLARLVKSDVDNTIQALSGAKYKWVHTFVWTSPEHRKTFSFDTTDMLKNIETRVSEIRNAWYIAQFSAEDATRTELDFLVEVYEKALRWWAQILNIPDTLGYYDVDQYMKLLEHLKIKFSYSIISTHTHNDKSQAEQSALVWVSKWFAQRIEWTIFGIGERAWNADIMTLISIIMQDKQYKELAVNILKNPGKFEEILEYMEEISWIHMRPVAPWYWHEAIVNRSWVHQAKVAKIKETYIMYPGEILGLDKRPQIEIWPLSWYHWVISKFRDSFDINVANEDAKKLTSIYRHIFSPDTDPHSIHTLFPDLSDKFLYNLGVEINQIREEARILKNSKKNIIKWNVQTEEILKRVFQEVFKVENNSIGSAKKDFTK